MNNFPYGPLTAAPPDFFPPEMWPEFGHIATPRTLCSREEIGIHPKGTRWGIWPLYFEEYVGDEAPDLAAADHGALAYSRFVLWNRVRDTAPHKGWVTLSSSPWRADGYYRLSHDRDFVLDWNKSARRDLREWQKKYEGSICRIEPIGFDEFKVAYKQSTVAKKTDTMLLDILERKQQIPACRDNSTIWGVRDLRTGKIIAGNVNYYSPTYKSSVREFPFILPEARGGHASVALMEHWMHEALRRDCPLAIATHFWQRGEPKDWKGFSAFKAQFGYTYVQYPPTLWKFRRGKIF